MKIPEELLIAETKVWWIKIEEKSLFVMSNGCSYITKDSFARICKKEEEISQYSVESCGYNTQDYFLVECTQLPNGRIMLRLLLKNKKLIVNAKSEYGDIYSENLLYHNVNDKMSIDEVYWTISQPFDQSYKKFESDVMKTGADRFSADSNKVDLQRP